MHQFEVQAMTCGHCASHVTRVVKHLDPQAKVEVNLEKKTVLVESSEDRASLAAALADAGYPAAQAARRAGGVAGA